MKKFLSVCLMVVMVVCMSVTAYAGLGEFLQSPSQNPAPELESFQSESADCVARLFITAYLNRNDLPEDARLLLEKAYAEIKDCKDLTELCAGLADVVKELGLAEVNLAVSDLFDISYSDCDGHDGHGKFDIVLKAETLDNFVALMQLTDKGWSVVEGAKVEKVDGVWHLYFSAEDFSPFAVVVNTSTVVPDTPYTGDNNNVYIYLAVMAVAVVAIVFAIRKPKKQTV